MAGFSIGVVREEQVPPRKKRVLAALRGDMF